MKLLCQDTPAAPLLCLRPRRQTLKDTHPVRSSLESKQNMAKFKHLLFQRIMCWEFAKRVCAGPCYCRALSRVAAMVCEHLTCWDLGRLQHQFSSTKSGTRKSAGKVSAPEQVSLVSVLNLGRSTPESHTQGCSGLQGAWFLWLMDISLMEKVCYRH